MCVHSDTRSNLKYLAYSPVQGVFRALGTDVTREGSCSSKHSAILEEFLQSQQRGREVSAHQADPNVPSPSSIAKLSSFVEHIRDLVIGTNMVGHMFEDSLPS
jgi:hypothetical protein